MSSDILRIFSWILAQDAKQNRLSWCYEYYSLQVNLKNVKYKKENRDCKKQLKQDENTGNLFYYI